jgi:hypothetical protein
VSRYGGGVRITRKWLQHCLRAEASRSPRTWKQSVAGTFAVSPLRHLACWLLCDE